MRLEPRVLAAVAGVLVLVGVGSVIALTDDDRPAPADVLVQSAPEGPLLSAPSGPSVTGLPLPPLLPSPLLPTDLLPTQLLPSPLLPTGLLPTELLPSPLLPTGLLPSPLLPTGLLPSPPTPSGPVTVPPGPPWVWPTPPPDRPVATGPGLRITLALSTTSAAVGDVVTATMTVETTGRTASFGSVCSSRPTVAGLHVDRFYAGPGGRAWTGPRQAFKLQALVNHESALFVPPDDDVDRRPSCTTVTVRSGQAFVDRSVWTALTSARSAYDGPVVVHGTLVVDGEPYELSQTLQLSGGDPRTTGPAPAIDLALSTAFGDFVAEGGTAGWVPRGAQSLGPNLGYAPDFPAGGRFYLESTLRRTGPHPGLGRASVWADTGELREVDVP